MSAVLTLGGVALNNNLYWSDRWSWHAADKTVTRTLAGNVVTFNAGLIEGRPITLQALDDQGWLTYAQVQSLYALAQTPGTIYALTIPQRVTEVLADPTLDTGSGWAPTAPWTIANGRATIDGSQGGTVDLTEAGSILREGGRYEVTFRIVGYAAGTVTPKIPGATGTARAGRGVYTEVLTADSGGGSGDFALEANSTFAGQIDYVSVRQVDDLDFNVQFRHDDAPAFNAVPLIQRTIPVSGDYFTATIKLMTV